MNKLGTLLAAVLVVLMAPSAHAAIQLSYDTGTGPVLCTGPTLGNTNAQCAAFPNIVTVDDIRIEGFAGSSTSPGTAVTAQEFSSTVSVTNNDTISRTVEFWVAAQGFTAPVTSGSVPAIQFSSNSGGTATVGTSSLTLQSCVDVDNDLAPPTEDFCSPAPPSYLLTNGTLTLTGPSGSDNNSVSALISPLSSTYSLSQHITLVMEAGATVNFSTSVILTPIPEPASVALFGTMMLVSALGLRRKFTRQ